MNKFKYLFILILSVFISGCFSSRVHPDYTPPPLNSQVCMQLVDKNGKEYIRHAKGCKDSWRKHFITDSQFKQFSEHGEPKRKYFK
tara:strand:+ start:1567 stop:1824 length:258 start_codon:yes stop_codon:yes gene_type:complete